MMIRPAVAVLNDIRNGRMLEDLGQQIHDACVAVRDHNKEATVTVKLVIAPFKGEHRLVEQPIVITADVDSKLPKEKTDATIFFIDDNGNAVRTQTRQPELGLSVAGGTGVIAAEGGKQ